MTYKEYANAEVLESGISCALPPRRIYVATTELGIYYTSNFTSSDVQPTWTAINSGLVSTHCIEFKLDPFHNDVRQYVLTEEPTLYRRENHGSWTPIFTQADRNALTGRSDGPAVMTCFNPDQTIDGRIWFISVSISGGLGGIEDVFYSSDYGDNWTIVTRIYTGKIWGIDGICAYGDNVYVGDSVGTGNYGYIEWSTNRGSTWHYVTVSLTGTPPVSLNKLINNGIYYNIPWGGTALHFFRNNGTTALKYNGIGSWNRRDTMWFDEEDLNHQRLVYNDRIYYTYNDWSTATTSGSITQKPYMISPYCREANEMIVGLSIVNGPSIGVISSEASSSVRGIAGANYNTPPYTDSIPYYTYEEICSSGIQEVDANQIVIGEEVMV